MKRLPLLLLATLPVFAQCPTGTLYPGALDTNASLTVAKNNIVTTLTVNQQIADTVAIVASTTGWVSNMMAAVDTGAAIEYEFVTSVSGANTLNVSRACEGSTAVVHTAGAPVDNNATAYSGHTSLAGAVTAIETLHGAAPTAHGIPIAEGTSPFTYASPGTAGRLLTSNGAAADPTFQTFGPGAGLPAGSQLNYLRIQPNTGNNTTTQFAAIPVSYNQSDYNFSAYSCNSSLVCSPGGSSGGSLIIGNNTLTLNPVPLGMNGTDQGHAVFISGGTGTQEGCVITGGTGTSGATTGTIIINCANTHTGAWLFQTNGAGLQEAIIAAEAAGGGIVQITTTAFVFAPITIQTASFITLTIQGTGRTTGPYLVRGSTFTAGDILVYNQTSGGVAITMQNFAIYNGGPSGSFINNTSGAAIHLLRAQAPPATLQNLLISDGWTAIDLDGVAGAHVFGIQIQNNNAYSASFSSLTGIRIHNTVGLAVNTNQIANITVIGSGQGGVAVNPLQSCIQVEFSDGLQVNNMYCGGTLHGIWFIASTNSRIDVISIGNCIFDVFQSHAIYFSGSGTPITTGPVEILDSWISTEYIVNTAYNGAGIFVDTGSQLNALLVIGTQISQNGQGGIVFNGATTLIGTLDVSASNIRDNNMSNGGTAAAIEFLGNSLTWSGIHVAGTHIYNSLAASHMTLGVYFPGTSDNLSNVSIEGNNFCPVGSGTAFGAGFEILSGAGSVYNKTVIRDNACVDSNTTTAVASAATVAFPIYQNFTITGTTNVTAITTTALWPGEIGTMIATSGALDFVAGATIGNTYTLQQNIPVSWYFDGTKVWLGGQNSSNTAFSTGSYTNATTTLSNVTGIAFTVAASTNYTVDCRLIWQGSAGTTGPKWTFTGPATPTAVSIGVQSQVTATSITSGVSTAFGTSVNNAGTITAATNFMDIVSIALENGANAGTLQLQAAANGAGTLTVQNGSWCRIQ